MRTFFIIFIILLIFGCKQSSKKIIDRYPDGQARTEYIYANKNDTSEYDCIVHYENGILKHETHISNNYFIGEKKSYFENGKIERIEKLSHPTLLDAKIYDCYITNYRPDGTKENEYQYVNDKLYGLAKDYDSSGNIERTTEYMDGKVNGLSTIYFPNGKIKSIAHCRNDSAYGYEYDFNENGDTLRARIHYGLSDENGVTSKKWLTNGRILTRSYGDSNRSFVIWKWYDKKGALIKSLVDKGKLVDSITTRFIEPE
jgi:antitoxin component YwqK of YwqJK toxin-antitoxin module